MSKVMQREMTITTVKVARTIVGDGGFPALAPVEGFNSHTIIGAATQAQAERAVKEALSEANIDTDGIVVFGLESTTDVYELPVETFFKYATIQVKLTDEEKAAKDKEKALEKATKAVERAKDLLAKAEKRDVELTEEMDKLILAQQAETDESEKEKLSDKLAKLQDRKTKSDTNVSKRVTDLVTAESELSKLQS